MKLCVCSSHFLLFLWIKISFLLSFCLDQKDQKSRQKNGAFALSKASPAFLPGQRAFCLTNRYPPIRCEGLPLSRTWFSSPCVSLLRENCFAMFTSLPKGVIASDSDAISGHASNSRRLLRPFGPRNDSLGWESTYSHTSPLANLHPPLSNTINILYSNSVFKIP